MIAGVATSAQGVMDAASTTASPTAVRTKAGGDQALMPALGGGGASSDIIPSSAAASDVVRGSRTPASDPKLATIKALAAPNASRGPWGQIASNASRRIMAKNY